MKKWLLLSVIFVLGCNQSDADKKNDTSSESISFKKILDNKNALAEKWYREANIDSVVTLFADNVIQMPPNQPPSIGIENLRKSWEQAFQWGSWNFSFKTQEARANGNLGVELGKYTLSFEPNSNSPFAAIKDTGNYVVHWEKINDDWKAVWDAAVSTIPIPVQSK